MDVLHSSCTDAGSELDSFYRQYNVTACSGCICLKGATFLLNKYKQSLLCIRFRIPARATQARVLCTRNGRREIDFTAAPPPSRRAVITFHVARSGLMRSTAAGHRRNNVYTLICSPPTCLGTSPCFMSLIKHFQHCHHHLATLM